ncbi:LysR substrate-binding domain-containing protein [Acuticoccus sp. M5D2P5]|uniref:LysR substrate-binding domain-containing protein n=1 Tax=Acuticoccus kalidii TaxID=2910977 RepID=UPI001F3C06F6|nr:LysR substrate-binding domain-containing protein [Acuticoccus kalidii]MCF3935210.1 LysR substrate-binding domain-containing protein [Acuticoccus kalidii]
MARANIRQIEAFNAVMKVGSVTGAAATLYVSQPAVTRLLKAFEESCGFPLFERRPGRLTPTREARQLFTETATLETGLVRVQRAARAIRDRERGEISVVAFPAIAMQLVPRVLARLFADRHDVRITLLTRTSVSVEDVILSRMADFGLSLLPAPSAALNSVAVREISFICALPSDHRLAGEKSIALADLRNERIISLGRDDLSYGATAAAFERDGVPLRPVAEVQMAEAANALVAEGYGVALLPSLMQAGPYDPDVVHRPLADPIRMKVWLISRSDVRLPRVGEEALEKILEALDALDAVTV